MRLMFPYMILACLGAVFMGMLNARGHFFIPALSPAILNVVHDRLGLVGRAALGANDWTRRFSPSPSACWWREWRRHVFQLPAMRTEGFRYHWVSPWREPTTREVVAKMIPSAIGVAAFQINVLLTQSLAFGENTRHRRPNSSRRCASWNCPRAFSGCPWPLFSCRPSPALAVEKNFDQFRSTLRQAVGHLIFVNLLASVLLFTLAEPIMRLLFERGKFDCVFDPASQLRPGLPCAGIDCFSLVNIFARAFYAMNDIKTPMHISVFCLTINLVFTAVFLFG